MTDVRPEEREARQRAALLEIQAHGVRVAWRPNEKRERRHRSGLSARQWRKFAQRTKRGRGPLSREAQRIEERARNDQRAAA